MGKGDRLHGLALCAGTGGLELGIGLALGRAYRTVGYVEREAYPAACLVARMADKTLGQGPIWDDLSTFDGMPWYGVVDLVSAGFPCQPFSAAGKHRGKADPRWLWPEISRVIREVGPRYVLLENVRGLARHGLDEVLGTLASLGFDAEWDLFSAASVGAPHRRQRFFLAAQSVPYTQRRALWDLTERGFSAPQAAQPGDPEPGDLGPQAVAHSSREGLEEWPEQPAGDQCSTPERGGFDAVAQPQHSRCPVGGEPEQSRVEGQARGEPDRCNPNRGQPWAFPPGPQDQAGWQQLFRPDLLPAEPFVRGVADGSANRMDRLRAAGNGVVPLVVAQALRVLAGRLGEG